MFFMNCQKENNGLVGWVWDWWIYKKIFGVNAHLMYFVLFSLSQMLRREKIIYGFSIADV